ncbi:Copia protein [Cucumis melo var. makuwa]|uniref:Copia protein n=1 Tax=Cucumis melo var. makuwa TaxID=1194695 RepID=A0A5D3BJS6_CUCMM|nr:Copia protein [Cucumis melo var. makuwa]TYJ98635.1 Copia protein [Cucumis melo var. makuwa]
MAHQGSVLEIPQSFPRSLPILGAIAQLGMLQFLGLISVGGKNPWTLDSGATDHDKFFGALCLLYPLCRLERMISTVRHSRGLYIVNDDTSGSSICRTSLLSSYFGTFEHDCLLWHFRVTTSFGKRWFITFMDDHTRLTWVFLIIDKSEEFQNHNLNEFLTSKEIVHQNSCAYTPQQNGGGNAIHTGTYLINRMFFRILYIQTGLDCLKESYLSTRLISQVSLCVFGCTTYVHNFGPNQIKFTPRAQACALGYTRKLDEYDHSLDIPIALRKGHKPVGCKWMFTLKYKVDGTLDRHKTKPSRGGEHEPSSPSDLKPSLTEISQLKQRMSTEFEIKDLGNLKYFLGMKVVRSKEGISVSQRKYTFNLLTEIVRSRVLCPRAMLRPNTEAYTDLDWVGSVVDRKSTFGYYTFVWSNLVTWRSKKQSVVSKSNAKANYRGLF